MTEQTKFQIKFKAIELLAKTLEPPAAGMEPKEINFQFSLDLKVAPEQKTVGVFTDVALLQIPEGKRLAFFRLLTLFEIVNFQEVVKEVHENLYDIPAQVEILLKSTGLSTIRGVIYSELRGTHLNNAVLPLIDIASIVMDARRKAKRL